MINKVFKDQGLWIKPGVSYLKNRSQIINKNNDLDYVRYYMCFSEYSSIDILDEKSISQKDSKRIGECLLKKAV